MDLFLFTNFFPYKKAEPFLQNEFVFAERYFEKISILSLYGNLKDTTIVSDKKVQLFEPILMSLTEKKRIFVKGFFNLNGFYFHFVDFFEQQLYKNPKKTYWFFTSLFVTRMILSSRSYKELLKTIVSSQAPCLYFYWGDNLAWIIPYLKRDLKNKKVKIVVRLHRTDLYEELKSSYAPLRNLIFSHSEMLVPISANGTQYLQKKYSQFANKIFLSRLGVFDHGTNLIQSESIKHVVSVSAVVEVKRVHLIFDVLQTASSNIVWHHFGDGPLLGDLELLTSQKRNNLQVILHGFIDNYELMRFYNSQGVDLFINLSASEGLPVSIMEALSFGIPVLATDVGGTSELVDETVGKLVPADFDINEVSNELEHLLSAEIITTKNLRKSAKERFKDKVDANKNYPAFFNLVLENKKN